MSSVVAALEDAAEWRLISKAVPSILTPAGLAAAIRSLYFAIRRAVTPAEEDALAKMIVLADRNWQKTRNTSAVIERMKKIMRDLGPVVAALALPVFEKHGLRVAERTRALTRSKYKLPIPEELSKIDHRLLAFVSESQTNFVTDEYRRRSVVLSNRMRRLVTQGLKENLFRDPFTRMLSKDLELQTLGRSKHYFDVVSRIYINRGRTLSALASYEEGGVQRYEFVAVLDARTSDICRMMHGKSWEVKAELDRFADHAQLRDPERIREQAPFVQRGAIDGEPALYYKRGKRKVRVAEIAESGVGRRGARGKFRNVMSDAALRRAGIVVPPLHGNCRSTIVPVIGPKTPLLPAERVPPFDELGKLPEKSQVVRLAAPDLPAKGKMLQIGDKPIAPTSEVRLDEIRSVFRRGQKAVDDTFGPRGMLIAVRRDGFFDVIDGRHRFLVAQEFPRIKVKATFTQGD